MSEVYEGTNEQIKKQISDWILDTHKETHKEPLQLTNRKEE